MMIRRLAALAITAAAVSSCSVLPAPPAALESDFVPSASPSPLPPLPPGADGFSPQEHAAVRVRVGTCTGWVTGSGWVLNDHQVVTNQHVIDDAIWIEISTYDGHDYAVASSQVAPVADLGLLTLEPNTFDEWPEWEARDLTAREDVSLIGYPEGQALRTNDGWYIGMEPDTVANSGEDVIGIHATVKHGNSGSPLYDADGVVVGTIYAGDQLSGGLAWPNTDLADLLDGTTAWLPNTASC